MRIWLLSRFFYKKKSIFSCILFCFCYKESNQKPCEITFDCCDRELLARTVGVLLLCRGGITTRIKPLVSRKALGVLFIYKIIMKQLCRDWLRKCSDCKEILLLDENNFYRSKTIGRFWYDNRCKTCDKIRKKTTKYKNSKKRKERIKIFDWYLYVVKSWIFYKIWATMHNDINKRIRSMMHWNPLEIIPIMIGKSRWDMFKEEKMFHRIYKSKNIKWERFQLSEGDISDIKKYYNQ